MLAAHQITPPTNHPRTPTAAPALSVSDQPTHPASLLSLKSAAFEALADIFASSTADHREKRLAAAVVIRYLATVESRRPHTPGMSESGGGASESRGCTERTTTTTTTSTPLAPTSSAIGIKPDSPPLAPPFLPLDSLSPAALLRARAGAAPIMPHAPALPHAGVNDRTQVRAAPSPIPRAPPTLHTHTIPAATFHQRAAAA